MNKLLVVIMLLPSFFAVGQDTTYYNSDGEIIISKNGCSYYEVAIHDPVERTRVIEYTYTQSGK